MKPIVVRPDTPKVERINLFEGEFENLLEVARPHMSEFQRNMVGKIAGEYTSRDKAEGAHNTACDHIHEGILNSLSKEIKGKFSNRHDEIRFILGLLSRTKELKFN